MALWASTPTPHSKISSNTIDNNTKEVALAGTHPVVDDLLEVHADSAAVDVGMSVAGMNQNADLLRPDLRRSISEHKQHRVDDVRLAAAVGSNDR